MSLNLKKLFSWKKEQVADTCATWYRDETLVPDKGYPGVESHDYLYFYRTMSRYNGYDCTRKDSNGTELTPAQVWLRRDGYITVGPTNRLVSCIEETPKKIRIYYDDVSTPGTAVTSYVQFNKNT